MLAVQRSGLLLDDGGSDDVHEVLRVRGAAVAVCLPVCIAVLNAATTRLLFVIVVFRCDDVREPRARLRPTPIAADLFIFMSLGRQVHDPQHAQL